MTAKPEVGFFISYGQILMLDVSSKCKVVWQLLQSTDCSTTLQCLVWLLILVSIFISFEILLMLGNSTLVKLFFALVSLKRTIIQNHLTSVFFNQKITLMYWQYHSRVTTYCIPPPHNHLLYIYKQSTDCQVREGNPKNVVILCFGTSEGIGAKLGWGGSSWRRRL